MSVVERCSFIFSGKLENLLRVHSLLNGSYKTYVFGAVKFLQETFPWLADFLKCINIKQTICRVLGSFYSVQGCKIHEKIRISLVLFRCEVRYSVPSPVWRPFNGSVSTHFSTTWRTSWTSLNKSIYWLFEILQKVSFRFCTVINFQIHKFSLKILIRIKATNFNATSRL